MLAHHMRQVQPFSSTASSPAPSACSSLSIACGESSASPHVLAGGGASGSVRRSRDVQRTVSGFGPFAGWLSTAVGGLRESCARQEHARMR